jgi:RNA polymerase sigma factor (sigma-70 family)
VIATHERLIRSRCCLWEIAPHEHEDLVSEAMLAALASLASWCASGGASFSSWICRNVDRRLGALQRRAGREPETVGLAHEPLDGTDPAQVALDRLAAEELLVRFYACLGSPEDRALFTLMSEGLTQLEMAQRLGLTQQRISQRGFRLRCHLEDHL